jgi:hypothetical protein
MKLISMTDYVLDIVQTPNVNEAICWKQTENRLNKIYKYSLFLKQPLELWMFVPCDENGNVLETPNPIAIAEKISKNLFNPIYDNDEVEQYQQAKERCLFEGFEWSVAQFCDEPMIELEDKKGNYLLFDCEDKNFQDGNELFFNTIESLTKYDLQLTQTAIKQLGI